MPKVALIEAVRKKDVDEVKRLLAQADVDPQAMDQNGMTALMLAASMQEPGDILELLLTNQRVKKDFQNNEKDTALIVAVRAGSAKGVDRLVWHIANKDLQNAEGHFALYIAVLLNNYKIVDRLLRGGANPCLMCGERRAIDYAIQDCQVDSDIIARLFDANKHQKKFVAEWEAAVQAKNVKVLEMMMVRNMHRALSPSLLADGFRIAIEKESYMLVSGLLVDSQIPVLNIEFPDELPELIANLICQEKSCFTYIFDVYVGTRAEGSEVSKATNRVIGNYVLSPAIRAMWETASATNILQSMLAKVRHYTNINKNKSFDDIAQRSASLRTLVALKDVLDQEPTGGDIWRPRLELRRDMIVEGLEGIQRQCKPVEVVVLTSIGSKQSKLS